MDEDRKKQRLATFLKWGAGLVGAAALAPIAVLALKGALAGLAFVVVGGVGLVIIKLTPWISFTVSNQVIKLISNEAARNPIETMEGIKIEKTKELEAADKAIIDFDTEVMNFDQETAAFAEQYPDEAPTYQAISTKMHQALDLQKNQQEEARNKLADLGQRIVKARAIYKMSLSAQKVTALSKSAEAQVFQQIREQVAFESVRTELNRSFASLNTALAQRKAVTMMPPSSAVPKLTAVPTKLEVVPSDRGAVEAHKRSQS